MDTAKKEAIKAKLLNRLKEIESYLNHGNWLVVNYTDPDEVAKKHAVEVEQVKIREALSFLEMGLYGVCQSCGNQISAVRLSLCPETLICGACAKQLEENQALHS